jgi:DNA-binding transcriptional MerR regulator
MPEHHYLSIGEVLALLLEEFPDVTISKIRFLESQGLIDPERTPSGYRKFYDPDVDRLRVILREQRENFLPLRVIRDRLESGEIDDSGALTPPRGLRNVTVMERPEPYADGGFDETGEFDLPEGTPVPTAHHPAAQLRVASSAAPAAPSWAAAVAATDDSLPSAPNGARPATLAAVQRIAPPPTPSAPVHVPERHENPAAAFFATAGAGHDDTARDTYVGSEVCTIAGITSKQLADLESYGLLAGKGTGTNALYSSSELAIACAAAGFLERGIEPRHLRAWRQSAEREAALFEQLVLPLIRQRNPQSRQQASLMLAELSRQGAELRAAILNSALAHHLEP